MLSGMYRTMFNVLAVYTHNWLCNNVMMYSIGMHGNTHTHKHTQIIMLHTHMHMYTHTHTHTQTMESLEIERLQQVQAMFNKYCDLVQSIIQPTEQSSADLMQVAGEIYPEGEIELACSTSGTGPNQPEQLLLDCYVSNSVCVRVKFHSRLSLIYAYSVIRRTCSWTYVLYDVMITS